VEREERRWSRKRERERVREARGREAEATDSEERRERTWGRADRRPPRTETGTA